MARRLLCVTPAAIPRTPPASPQARPLAATPVRNHAPDPRPRSQDQAGTIAVNDAYPGPASCARHARSWCRTAPPSAIQTPNQTQPYQLRVISSQVADARPKGRRLSHHRPRVAGHRPKITFQRLYVLLRQWATTSHASDRNVPKLDVEHASLPARSAETASERSRSPLPELDARSRRSRTTSSGMPTGSTPRSFRSCMSLDVDAHAGAAHHPTHGPTHPRRSSTPAWRGRRPQRRWLRARGHQGPWRTAGAAPGHLPHAGHRRGAHSPCRVTRSHPARPART